MIDKAEFDRLEAALPVLARASDELAAEFRRHAFKARVPAGRDVFVAGDQVNAIPLLVSGSVRVYQIGETGREVTLYRFRPGESCVLTANAILTEQSFPAIATAEEDAQAVMIPAPIFREWVAHHAIWRDFFIELVSQRLASVMALVDQVAFQRMDRRVAAYLSERSAEGGVVHVTHQEIALELGSSREVISRILEDLVERGLIMTGRGQIETLDSEALRELSGV